MAILSFPSQGARGAGALTQRGRNVARGGVGLVRGLEKEQGTHGDLYLVWGREVPRVGGEKHSRSWRLLP